MKKTDLIKQIASAITKAAKKVDPKVKVQGAKTLSALSGARLADDLILDNIPGLKQAMIWTDEKIEKGRQWLLDNTLGRIPGVGPVLSKLSKDSTAFRYKVRDALFGSNHPSWYEHLPQHVPFSVPGNYNNKVIKFSTGTGYSTTIPSVATLNLFRNIVTTSYATSSRYTEIYTAVKYARGLSYLPYTVNQLALMFEIGNELTTLYYRIAKAVSAAFHFSLSKANLPSQILKGLALTDVVDEYANYATLLDQMYNYMSVNVPLLPIMHDKLKQMCLFTALDAESPAMSTYLQALVANNTIRVTDDGQGFYASADTPTNLDACKSRFKYYMDLLSADNGATSQLLNVIADVKGSISGVSYVENWRNISFKNTFTNDNLFLNSIKNMDLVPTLGIVGTLQGTDFGFVCSDFVSATQGSTSSPISISKGMPMDIALRFKSQNTPTGQTFTPKYVCCSGSKTVKAFAKNIESESSPYNFDVAHNPNYSEANRLISLEGTENSEGKVLETLSLGCTVTKMSLEAPSGNTPCFSNIFIKTGLFVCAFINVANDYDSNETKRISNHLAIPGWVVQLDIFSIPTTWTLIDWMPYVKVTQFNNAANYYTMNLWDINGIGLLSDTAMDTAIDYITYSLLYPGDVEALNKTELASKLLDSLKTK